MLDLRAEMRKTDNCVEGMTKDHQIGPMATISRLSDYRRRPKPIFFSRPELNQLLSLYSRQVARGAWRDYAIDQHDGAALFSVFRHSRESPLYTIVKTAPGVTRNGDFTLLSGRHRLAKGHTLSDVIGDLQRRLRGSLVLSLDAERRR
jgi:hypothetical protein